MATKSKIKALAVNTARANAGLINEIIDATLDQWMAGEDFDSCLTSAQSQIADAALNRHGEKVRAGLARVGLEVQGDTLSAAAIAEAVSKKSGLEIDDFSPDGILRAVDRMIAYRLSEVSGVKIDSVIGEDLPTVIKSAVRAALRSGTAKKLITHMLDRRARTVATLRRLGSDKAEYKKLRNRAYQSEWRKRYKQQWV